MGTRRHTGRAAGFTLMEMLVVVLIISLLVGMLFPAIYKARERARIVKAQGVVRELDKVWRMYFRVYDSLPSATEMNAAMCQLLAGDNANNIQFLTCSDLELSQGMMDPWGRTYKLELDATGQIPTQWHYATRIHPGNAR